MQFMPWTDDFLIGIAEIDDQHRWLVDTTNKLHDEITKQQRDRNAISEILYGLVEYAINHFIVEEDLFERFGYPQSDSHVKEHNSFNKNATKLLQAHEAGEEVSEQALEFLKNWLQHHILVNDKAYVPHLKDKVA
jgi:hemerythrin